MANTRRGLLHLYCGDGKGKTTAAVGLATRAVGGGCPVAFAQFLKDEQTGELVSLETLGIPVFRSQKHLGFTFLMDEETKLLCAAEQRLVLAAVAQAAQSAQIAQTMGARGSDSSQNVGPQMLVVLDEALDALDLGFLEEGELRAFIDTMPNGIELVLTGRKAPAWLADQADYHTEFKKHRHPYDQGIPARGAIEF
jgi:cob(I)alamin adenosyltransferase